MVKPKVFVLGAGMSGLVVAYEFLRKGFDVTVIEKLEIPGGLSRTHRFNDIYIDAGPHLFHTSNEDIVSYWKSLFSDIFLTPSLFGKNFIDGKYYDYPLTEETLANLPDDVQSKIEKERNDLDPANLQSAKSYKDYINALAGPTLQGIFFEDYPKKLWGIQTSELSSNWAPRRIEIRKKKKPFHATQWCGVAKFGCGQVMERLAEKVIDLGGEIQFSTMVNGFKVNGSRIDSIETNQKVIKLNEDDLIVSTLPITVNSQFLDISCKLGFRSVKLVSIVIIGDDPLPEDADWLYFKDPEIIFHRAGLQTRFSRHGIPDKNHILCCEIAYSDGDHISDMSESILTDKVLSDLKKVKIIDENSVILKTYVMNLGPVYPAYYLGYEEVLQSVKSQIDKFQNFYYTGTLADFSYADFQILCAKAIDLVEMIASPTSNYNHIQKEINLIESFNDSIKLGKHLISLKDKPFVIAEIGLNHNGSVELAKKLIQIAVEAGCDAVKLQTFTKERISGKVLDSRHHETLLDMEESLSQLFNRLIFSKLELEEIFSYAKKVGIEIFSTPFDLESLETLSELDVPAYKIASMDLVNLPLIKAVAKKMKPIIISTGMSNLGDVEDAVNVVKEVGNPNLILMHCVSSYPARAEESNIRAIQTIASSFKTIVGFSDHLSEIYLVPAAIALGARVIEKHVTLDRGMKGPDHNFSLEKNDLKILVEQAYQTYQSLGDGIKKIMPSERQTIQKLRRSIFAKVEIKKGELITEEMLIIKSPGIGILPKYMNLLVGRVARDDIKADYPVTWEKV